MSSTLVALLGRAAVPAMVVVVLALIRQRFAIKSTPEIAVGCSLDQLGKRFAFIQWLVSVGLLLVGAAIAFGIWAILVFLSRWAATWDGTAELVLLPQTAIWWFLPGFAGLALTWEVTLAVWSAIGNQAEVALYSYWSDAKAGFDSKRVFRIMALWIVLPIAILTLLAIPWHVALGHDEIRVRGYGFRDVQVYRYSEARKMTIIRGFRRRDGSLQKRAGIVLDFSDGRRWSSADIGDFKPSVDVGLLRFLEDKTGLQPQYAVAESDIGR